MATKSLRVAGYETDSIVDGPGIRSVLFLQGCPHHCSECHNSSTWDFKGGKRERIETIAAKLRKNNFTRQITISGGEPLVQYEGVRILAEQLFKDGYELILYTGFDISDLKEPKQFTKNEFEFFAFLSYFRFIVTGKFIKEQKDISLLFRGSSNQRLVRFVSGHLYDVTDDITQFATDGGYL